MWRCSQNTLWRSSAKRRPARSYIKTSTCSINRSIFPLPLALFHHLSNSSIKSYALKVFLLLSSDCLKAYPLLPLSPSSRNQSIDVITKPRADIVICLKCRVRTIPDYSTASTTFSLFTSKMAKKPNSLLRGRRPFPF